MTLLDVISKAVTNADPFVSQLEHPIVLNSEPILLNLKPELDDSNSSSLVSRVTGWEVSESDSNLIDLSKKFFTKLQRKLKNTNSFAKDEFVRMLNLHLEKMKENGGISIGVDPNSDGYTRVLIENVASLMGRDVVGLVLKACISFEAWELLDALIVSRIFDLFLYSYLVSSLVAKKRSDLLCLLVKNASTLGSSELLSILKYFLCPPKSAYASMAMARKEWESQALLAIEKLIDDSVVSKKSRLTKEAAILLMVAHDEFSDNELCLHYLLASSNVDAVVLSSSIAKLNGKEMMNLIRYLGKWLKKYERFPQVVPCPKASSSLGLTACDWVPKLEAVVKCLGMVLDENFSSLVLHSEFHKELKAIGEVVGSLAFEARFCGLMANVVEKLTARTMQN